MASTYRGCAYPRLATPTPASRSMYRLPSASKRIAPSPRSMQRRLKSATLCVPGARCSASASNSAAECGPGTRVSTTGRANGSLLTEEVENAGRDRRGRFLADRRVAGPVVHVDQDGSIDLGKCGVATEGLEAECPGGAAREPLERPQLEGRSAARLGDDIRVEERGAGDPVELDHGSGDVSLHG